MKKYQRLFLVIISVISLSLFLIYRHHYNRLHHVLEVFNFFGTPCNFSELQQTQEDLPEHDWGPQPLWQQVDSKEYIYSAFLVGKKEVQGIGVRHNSATLPKTCILYFEDENRPFKGKFSIQNAKQDKLTGFLIYKYTCAFLNNEKNPYSIAFKSQSGQKFVSSLINNNLDRKVKFNVTICVAPSSFTKKSLLEFLSFQNLVGVDSFVVYFEQNIPYKLIKLLKNLSRTLGIWITFLPYNFPLDVPPSFANSVIEYDCQFRTVGHSKYSLVLGINEYIVPSLDTKSLTLSLPVKKFCLNHANKHRPMVLQNFELTDDYNFNEVKKVYKINYRERTNVLKKIPIIFENSCVIHRYEKCERGLKTKTDVSLKRYSTDFTRSTLVQLLIHEEEES